MMLIKDDGRFGSNLACVRKIIVFRISSIWINKHEITPNGFSGNPQNDLLLDW